MRPRRIPALWLRMNVEIRTRRATGAACWETIIYFGRTLLSRRGSRTAEGADKIKFGRNFLCDCESCNRSGRLHGHVRRRLWNRGVSDVADLAIVLVVRVAMPVADRVRDQQGQRDDDRYCQQTFCCALHHVQLKSNLQYVAIAGDRAIKHWIHKDRNA
jgi:hypothetical protein